MVATLENITARLDAYLDRNGLPLGMEDARLYRHNTRKGLAFAADDPELSALCRARAMAAALRIRIAARRIRREQRVAAQRETAVR